MPPPEQVQLARLLLARLERVSVDSYWAHRASGVRGALLRTLELIENRQSPDPDTLQKLIDQGFRILEQAARNKGR